MEVSPLRPQSDLVSVDLWWTRLGEVLQACSALRDSRAECFGGSSFRPGGSEEGHVSRQIIE